MTRSPDHSMIYPDENIATFAATRRSKIQTGVRMGARNLTLKQIASSALAATATLVLALSAAAQGNGMNSNGFSTAIHGVPPSVTSFGFGGQPGFHGVPASVTSLGFGSSPSRINHGPFFFPHHHRNSGFVSPFLGNIVPVPDAYPLYVIQRA